MKKVRVAIEIEELVQYHKYVEMDEENFKRLDAALSHESLHVRERAAEELRCYIDPKADFSDARDLDVTDFRIAKAREAA